MRVSLAALPFKLAGRSPTAIKLIGHLPIFYYESTKITITQNRARVYFAHAHDGDSKGLSCLLKTSLSRAILWTHRLE